MVGRGGWTKLCLSLSFIVAMNMAGNVPPVRAVASASCATSELNVVAHQDDDILFMNPDISDSIHQGRCVETVFLTGGEWNGVSGSLTREQYAASRDQGARAAYAAMAGVPNAWTRTGTMVNGHNLEVATLNGAPNVRQVYLSIRDGGDDVDPWGLQGLYQSTRSTITTLVPSGSSAGIAPVTYTRANLTQTLLALMSAYQATLVRTQDYMPSTQLADDHSDHVFGALFVMEAAKNYRGVGNDLHVAVQTYRDYNITNSPVNLSGTQASQKSVIIDAYKVYDPIFAIPGDQATLAQRMYYRWPVAPTWVAANADGRLQAFDVQSGHLVTWQQNTAKAWQPMQDLGNSMLQPGIGVGKNTNGTLMVFAIKQTINGQGQVQQSLQYIKRTTPGGSFSAWQNLGSPNPGTSSSDLSSPAVVANGDGRLEVFLKDSTSSLATIYQTSASGGFSGWVGLGGNSMMEAPAALLRPDGRIEVYSATLGVVDHWLQRAPNGAVQFDTAFTSVQAVGLPSTGFNEDGRPEIFYRHAGDGRIFTTFETPSGGWFGGDVDLGSQVAQGAPAAVSTLSAFQVGSRIKLLARTGTGLETTVQGGDNDRFILPWQPVAGTYTQHAPAAIVDTAHQVHWLIISPDGVLTDTAG